jgi:hypothetical protein
VTETFGTALVAAALLLAASGALGLLRDLHRRAARLEALREAAKVERRLRRQSARLRGARALDAGSALYAANRTLQDIDAVYPLHVVFGPVKTGCTTLTQTIGRLDLCSNLHTAHQLSAAGMLELQRKAYGQRDPVRRTRILRHFRECCVLRGILHARRSNVRALGLEQHPFARPWVVTAVREPVARALSAVFYEQGHHLVDAAARGQVEVIAEVRQRVLERLRLRKTYEEWVVEELLAVFGFDPFAAPFPQHRGWACAETDRARLLLIRLESFDRLPVALGEFFGVPAETIRVRVANTARERPDNDLYIEAGRTLSLPRDELQRLYAVPGVAHFYSPDEIDGFLRRWTAG